MMPFFDTSLPPMLHACQGDKPTLEEYVLDWIAHYRARSLPAPTDFDSIRHQLLAELNVAGCNRGRILYELRLSDIIRGFIAPPQAVPELHLLSVSNLQTPASNAGSSPILVSGTMLGGTSCCCQLSLLAPWEIDSSAELAVVCPGT